MSALSAADVARGRRLVTAAHPRAAAPAPEPMEVEHRRSRTCKSKTCTHAKPCGYCVRMDQYIQRMVEKAPPLTAEQRDRLAVLLRGAR